MLLQKSALIEYLETQLKALRAEESGIEDVYELRIYKATAPTGAARRPATDVPDEIQGEYIGESATQLLQGLSALRNVRA
jgi:hypothetical protein